MMIQSSVFHIHKQITAKDFLNNMLFTRSCNKSQQSGYAFRINGKSVFIQKNLKICEDWRPCTPCVILFTI